MRESGMRGATDGTRKGGYVDGTSTTYRRKPRAARIAVNVVASECDLQRLADDAADGRIADVKLHLTKRGDVRMVSYIRK